MNIRFNNWKKKLESLEKNIDNIKTIMRYGYVFRLVGISIHVVGLSIPINSICMIECGSSEKFFYVEAIVIGFSGKYVFLTLFQLQYDDIFPGARVFPKNYKKYYFHKWPIGRSLLGRILDGRGYPIDHKPLLNVSFINTLSNRIIHPLNRSPVNKIFDTGIRSINALLTLGQGQKVGLFSQSGLGKSVLIGMMSKHSEADVTVIGLIGERNREVQEFIQNSLGKKGLNRSVLIIVPSNSSPILKIQGAMYAMRIAEYFRDENQNVLLIIDSLTRYAMSEREISLSMGEIPLRQGYPSSIFSKLPHFIERSGNNDNNCGSITALYTVLIENEDNDVILEISKSILDGHIILSKFYADSGHYPAIDISESLSRVMVNIVQKNHYEKSKYLKKLVSEYHKCQDLINVGAYINGSNVILDESIKKWELIKNFLKQDISDYISYHKSVDDLNKII
ncbi:FliI/YscN family ATPase [Buchnera aphidicola]|uniref:FliI/YscN family ATPase n=1 Tax=Buchnera aphidicola TaxID=9 RepID=UPI0034643513